MSPYLPPEVLSMIYEFVVDDLPTALTIRRCNKLACNFITNHINGPFSALILHASRQHAASRLKRMVELNLVTHVKEVVVCISSFLDVDDDDEENASLRDLLDGKLRGTWMGMGVSTELGGDKFVFPEDPYYDREIKELAPRDYEQICKSRIFLTNLLLTIVSHNIPQDATTTNPTHIRLKLKLTDKHDTNKFLLHQLQRSSSRSPSCITNLHRLAALSFSATLRGIFSANQSTFDRLLYIDQIGYDLRRVTCIDTVEYAGGVFGIDPVNLEVVYTLGTGKKYKVEVRQVYPDGSKEWDKRGASRRRKRNVRRRYHVLCKREKEGSKKEFFDVNDQERYTLILPEGFKLPG